MRTLGGGQGWRMTRLRTAMVMRWAEIIRDAGSTSMGPRMPGAVTTTMAGTMVGTTTRNAGRVRVSGRGALGAA